VSLSDLPVLIVDDDEFQRRMIRIKLQTRGHEVNEAKDGIEALEFLEHQDYSAVLLDIVMPQLNGWEVLDQIRSRYSREALPVIMMTARDTEYDAEAAIDRGANDYLTKPIDFAALDQRIDTCTANAASAAEAEATAALADAAEDTHRDLLPHVAEQSLAMLDSLLGNLPAIVFRVVGDGTGNVHLSYQSDRLHSFLGRNWNSVQEIIASTDNTRRHNINRQFREKGRLLQDFYARFPVNLSATQQAWVECRGTPHRLPSGETVWDALLIDCSQQYAAQQMKNDATEQTSDESRYRDPQGFVHQCSQCRKVRDFNADGQWLRVDAWTRHMPLQTSHTVCEECARSAEVSEID